jgi:diguanylate cyclase (GGDEF)-like protein
MNRVDDDNSDAENGEMGSGDGLGSGPGSTRLRDVSADRRDLAADERDVQADVRDGAASAANSAERPSSHLPSGRGWERRSARERQLSAGDRMNSARDRKHAADDRASVREHLAHEAIDPLTGAMRRQAGLAAMAGEFGRSERADDDLVVAFADTVGLKAINGSRGHAAGDRVLQDIAECLAGGGGEDDVVVRIGGGGFVCSLVHQNMDQADLRYAQISARLAGRSNGAQMTVGLASRRTGDTLESLIDRADQVMLGRIFNGRLGAS